MENNHEQFSKARKIEKFNRWLVGENVEFPFFKDLPEVKMPKNYERG